MKLRIVNKDKFTRAVTMLLLIISLVGTMIVMGQKKEVEARVISLEEQNINIRKTYYEVLGEVKELRKELDEEKTKVEPKIEFIESEEDSIGTEVKVGVTPPTRGGEPRKLQEVYLEVTMYTNAEGAFPKDSEHYGLTASGVYTHWGVAAGPKELPFGTKIQLVETKKGWEHLLDTKFEIKDRGGKIVKKEKDGKTIYCIDIYNPSLTDALNWGRQTIKGYIIAP